MLTPPAPRAVERIGHRGSPRERTENTLESFLLALDHGADGLELDVHVTRDGRVVVHHDFDVSGRAIAATDWDDLKAIELKGGSGIPLLEDVLAAVGSRGSLYVELKGRGIEAHVAEVMRGNGHRCAFHSFDHEAIARCARTYADIPRGILIDRDEQRPLEVLAAGAGAAHPRDVWPHWSLVDAKFMDAAAALGLRVIPWTVNDRAVAARLLALGVAGVCTDDVRLLDELP